MFSIKSMYQGVKTAVVNGYNAAKDKVAAVVGTVTAGVATALVPAQQAEAALPIAVTDAITAMQTDAIALATLVLVAIISVVAIKFLRKGI